MDGQKIERSKTVKCLGVLLDDGLTWKEQVQSVRKQCFAGLAKLRRLLWYCHTWTIAWWYAGLLLEKITKGGQNAT